MRPKKGGILEIQVILQGLEQEKDMALPLQIYLTFWILNLYTILYHPKTFADFSAASSNACLGSLTPK